MSKHERKDKEERREERHEEHKEHEKRARGGGVEKKKRDHEKLNTGGGVIARKRGGGIKPEDTRPTAEGTEKDYPTVARVDRPHHRFRVVKRRGGKVDGKKAERRIDRRARGGGIEGGGPASHHAPTKPGWPYSGAEAPDMGYTRGATNSKPRGAGKDPVR